MVIGAGGREHALVWRLAQSESVTQIYATPGNPGMAKLATCLPHVPQTPVALLRAAQEFQVDLTVVGPEAPLVAGVVDAFRAAAFRIVGPTEEQARLEGSKIFAKKFFEENGIPTAEFHAVTSTEEARAALKRSRFPLVIKADGLAAGKGVIIAQDKAEAEAAIEALGPTLVMEEFLRGEEVSFIALCDGRNVVPFEPCQDHKRIFDGDQGPNTGGMGAYCDSRILTDAERDRVMKEIIAPTMQMTDFNGFLYAGLMMTEDGPMLLEYNVRLGDPETQPLMHRMLGDFGELLLGAAEGRLHDSKLHWNPQPSVCVVLASEGYPGTARGPVPIMGISEAESVGCTVFHGGTSGSSTDLKTAGGRVLGVTSRGTDLGQAIQNTYAGVYRIAFPGMQFRHDIGSKGLRRWTDGPLQ